MSDEADKNALQPPPGVPLVIRDSVISAEGGAVVIRGSEQAVPEALPLRVEQTDHVELVQALARKREAEQALELAQLRLQLAQRELAAAEAARVACAERLGAKYRITDADTITPDGAIWRAARAEGQG